MTTVVIRARGAMTGVGSEYLEHATLVIKDGVIESLSSAPSEWIADDNEIVHYFPEHYLLPGLIDTHVHLVLPGDGTPAHEFISGKGDSDLLQSACQNAEKALIAGVTTLRDVGSRGWVLFELRDAIATGQIAGPRLLLSGPPITPTAGHCHYFGGEADGADAIRAKIRELLDHGVDLIKVMGSGGGTPGTYFWQPTYSPLEIQAAVEEVRWRNSAITVHATCVNAIETAVEAGVNMIEHASMWATDLAEVQGQYRADLVEEIVRKDIFVGRTLPATYGTLKHLQERERMGFLTPDERQRLESRLRIFEFAMDSFRRFHSDGVRLVAGTDAGWDVNLFGQDYVAAVELAVEAGMTPLEAIEHATSEAAAAIGVQDEVGALRPGLVADCILAPGDPFKDVRTLRQPLCVFQRGEMIVRDGRLIDENDKWR